MSVAGGAGRAPVPADTSALFEGALDGLRGLYSRVRGRRATRAQRGLWLEQMRGSGIAPESGIDDLFVTHTLLVLVARMVADSVGGRRGGVSDGFVGWVTAADRSHVDGLLSTVGRHDWVARRGDALREIYGRFVGGSHRKALGEYYTPDWLAEMVCEEVIDDEFIAAQAKAFMDGAGTSCVLDPACGSGTFLYSAARRILGSGALEESCMDGGQRAALVSSMVCGMDIHPVAVEMARANMARAVPGMPQAGACVRQGDPLLARRPGASVLGDGGRNAVLLSPAGRAVAVPMEYLAGAGGIDSLAESARSGGGLPESALGGLSSDAGEALRAAHMSLREVAAREGGGAWLWHMRRQAFPALLMGRSVGRIVSNPPWVTLQEMRDTARKAEVREMARGEGVWEGGVVAPRFDVAGLFVKRCTSMYLGGGRAAWVLPQGAAVSGRNWAGFRGAMRGKIAEFWDLGRLPFPWTPACVAIGGQGSGEITRTYSKARGARIGDGDGWASVRPKIVMVRRRRFAPRRSHWFGRDGGLPVRHGASLQPAPLVRIGRVTGASGGRTSFLTHASHKSPWSLLGSLEGTVPSSFVKDTIISTYVFPFAARCSKAVIPVRGGAWDPGRKRSRYWRGACAHYEKYRGVGPSNPKTLEGCIDHNGKLMRQLGSAVGHRVVYNAVGDVLYAARLKPGVIGGVGVCVVSAASKAEALFLAGLLNAPCLLGAYLSTRRSDRNFHLHFWSAIPIPRYDRSDADHARLVSLVRRAESIASGVKVPDSPRKAKRLIRGALADVLSEIDEVASRILPGYARRVGSAHVGSKSAPSP